MVSCNFILEDHLPDIVNNYASKIIIVVCMLSTKTAPRKFIQVRYPVNASGYEICTLMSSLGLLHRNVCDLIHVFTHATN